MAARLEVEHHFSEIFRLDIFRHISTYFDAGMAYHGITVLQCASKARQTLIQAAQSGKLLAALQAATAKTAKVGSRT